MWLNKKIVALVFLCLFYFYAGGQKTNPDKGYRVLILLDGSSSMLETWQGTQSRFQTAAQIITRLMDSVYRINPDVEFALRVYGHQFNAADNNCYDTRREVMFSRNNITQMDLRLSSLRPVGVSPIAYSLMKTATEDFDKSRDYAYSLILITDGGESCNGDLCAVAKTLLERKIHFRPYIVSLIDYEPLKIQYDCMGNYLVADNPEKLSIVIDTITRTYKRELKIPVKKTREEDPVVPKAPPVNTARTRPGVPAPAPPPQTAKARDTVEKPLVVVKDTVPAKIEEPVRSSKIKVETSVPKVQISAMRRNTKIQYFPVFWSTPKSLPRKVPPVGLPKGSLPPEPEPRQNINPASRTSSTAIKPAPVAQPKLEETIASFNSDLKPAEETLLELYFTDGKGKFYTTTPMVRVFNAQTGAEVKKFTRFTDAAGKPDPVELAPGEYHIRIGKTGNYIVQNVKIIASNTNKVTVVVTKGTLSFGYTNNTKKPVSEFTAQVRKTFESGGMVYQKCDTQLDYEPSNYHIEINTLPVSRRNIDLDFGVSYRIDIDEPGFVQFSNLNSLGNVRLLCQLGDKFVQFHRMNIKGKPEEQKLRLQPGKYEVHYRLNPEAPVPYDKIVSFTVRSNETTTVEIPQ